MRSVRLWSSWPIENGREGGGKGGGVGGGNGQTSSVDALRASPE